MSRMKWCEACTVRQKKKRTDCWTLNKKGMEKNWEKMGWDGLDMLKG